MSNFHIVDKLEFPLWRQEVEEFLEYQQTSGHRLANNYFYDYENKSDEITILIQDDEIFAMCCMIQWNKIATRVMYRWSRDRRKDWSDHVNGELTQTVLHHQLPKVITPYAFIGLDGKRDRLIKKWADPIGWKTTAGWVKPKCHQQIAYVQLKDTNQEFYANQETKSNI